MPNQLIQAAGSLLTYSYQEMIINIVLAMALGLAISLVYKYTHKGLSYSQSFTQTLLYVAVIVAIVMMVIGSSLARAFALVGALSIIRFRTVVKDTRDISFIFASLAVGMAAGTSNYFLASVATGLLIVMALIMGRTNFGALYKSEFILRFVFAQGHESSQYLNLIQQHSKKSNLLHIEPSGDGASLKITYDITLNPDYTAEQFSQSIATTDGISEVVLIASKSDVDY